MGNLINVKSSKELDKKIIEDMNDYKLNDIDEVIMILNEDYPLNTQLRR